MIFPKKSLGQNFLIDKNILKKISNVISLFKKDVVEIGPGKGALTDEIIKKKPKSLMIIEKDEKLVKYLKVKYSIYKNVKVINADILKFDLEKVIKKNTIILGNLPYNISSQILVKIIKFEKWPLIFSDLILMFQKELGEKILGNCPAPNYGRLSILTNLKLNIMSKFLVKPNSFSPKPKVNSLVIHFKSKKEKKFNIKVSNLEKITNIFFSNKRKMIKKNLEKLLTKKKIDKIKKLNLSIRPIEVPPDMYYKITELYELR